MCKHTNPPAFKAHNFYAKQTERVLSLLFSKVTSYWSLVYWSCQNGMDKLPVLSCIMMRWIGSYHPVIRRYQEPHSLREEKCWKTDIGSEFLTIRWLMTEHVQTAPVPVRRLQNQGVVRVQRICGRRCRGWGLNTVDMATRCHGLPPYIERTCHINTLTLCIIHMTSRPPAVTPELYGCDAAAS